MILMISNVFSISVLLLTDQHFVRFSSHYYWPPYCSHGSSPPPPILGVGGLKISDQINWGAPEQKIKFGGGELNFMGGLSQLYKTPKSGSGTKMCDKK